MAESVLVALSEHRRGSLVYVSRPSSYGLN